LQRLGWVLERARGVPSIAVEISILRREPKWQAELEESLLLCEEVERFGELPPGNATWERWWQERVLRAIVRRTCDGAIADVAHCYDWPRYVRDLVPVATCLDVYSSATSIRNRPSENWRCTLMWIWPQEWLPNGATSRHCGELVLLARGYPATKSAHPLLRELDSLQRVSAPADAFMAPRNWRGAQLVGSQPASDLADSKRFRASRLNALLSNGEWRTRRRDLGSRIAEFFDRADGHE
jgi:hypothetical protein